MFHPSHMCSYNNQKRKKRKKKIRRKKHRATPSVTEKVSEGHNSTYEKLKNSEWNTVNDGLSELKGLINDDPDLCLKKMQYLLRTLGELVSFPNKTVQKASMVCIGLLFEPKTNKKSRRTLQVYIKELMPILINKRVDKTKMLSQEAKKTLILIIENSSVEIQYDIIKSFMEIIQKSNSPAVVEHAAHHLYSVIDQCKTSLIKDNTSRTPIFDIIKSAAQLLYGRTETARKAGRDIITVLAEEATDQGSFTKFRQNLESTAPKKTKERVGELIQKIREDSDDSEEEVKLTKRNSADHSTRHRAKTSKGPRQKHSSNLDANVKYTDTEDLEIDGSPKEVYRKSKETIKKGPDYWKEIFEGLNDLRYLAVHHPKILEKDINKLVTALLPHVTNLRSSIVKNTLLLFEEMFIHINSGMDKTLKFLLAEIIRKSADSNDFLAEGGVSCSKIMVLHCTPKILLTELIIMAQKEPSTTVRGKAVFFTHECISVRLNQDIFEKKYKSTLEDIITTLSPLLHDKSQETRQITVKLSTLILDSAIATGNIGSVKKIVKTSSKMNSKYADKMVALIKERETGGDSSPKGKSQKKSAKKSGKKKARKKKKIVRKDSSSSDSGDELADDATF